MGIISSSSTLQNFQSQELMRERKTCYICEEQKKIRFYEYVCHILHHQQQVKKQRLKHKVDL